MAENELKVIIKAKELAKHTLLVTSNANRYPKKFRFSLVDKMQNKSMEIYEMLFEANSIVFDPFAGIGSVPYMAVKLNRRGLGCELKESYYKQAVKNLEVAAANVQEDDIVGQMNIGDFIGGIQ